MNHKRQFILAVLTGFVLTGIVLALTGVLPVGAAAEWVSQALSGRARLAQSGAATLEGTYIGQVKLDWALPGEYSDPLPTPQPGGEPPPDLGIFDLGLLLSQSSSAVSGYLDLQYTLVFTSEHTIESTRFGPSVQGMFDGQNLTLESERVSLVTAGQRLMRQFRLIGAVTPGNKNVLTGEYRETVWGYGSQPLTIIGTFTLQKLPSGTFESKRIYLPIVTRR